MLSSFAFAVTPVLVRLAFEADVNEFSLITFRSIVAAAALAALSRFARETTVESSAVLRLIALGAFLFAPQMWTYFLSLRYLDTSVAVAIIYIYPAVVAILIAILRRCLPTSVEMALLGVALAGVIVIMVFDGGRRMSVIGVALACVTAVGYALYVVVADSVVRSLPPLAAGVWVVVGTGISTLVVAVVSGQLQLPSSTSGWTLVAVHGLIVVPMGLGCFYAGLVRLGATKASIVDTSQPAIAVLAGTIVLDEWLSPLQLLGVCLVTFAVLGLPILTELQARRASRSPVLGRGCGC